MNIKRIFLVALAVCAISACHKNNPVPEKIADSINVTAGVMEPTRAGYDSQNLPETFYLTLVQDENDPESKYNYVNEAMIKGDGNEYSTAAGTALYWMDQDHSLVKANAYTTEGETFEVLMDQTSESNLNKSDLLGATEEDLTIDEDNLNVNFRHLLCKLDVTFRWDDALADVNKQVTSVVYSGFGSDVALDRDNAVVSSGENTGDIHAYLSVNEQNNTSLSEAIFAPQTSDLAILITAVIGDKQKDYTLHLVSPNGGFVTGNLYTINVKISNEVVYFEATPTLRDWEEGSDLEFTEETETTIVFTASTDNSETK